MRRFDGTSERTTRRQSPDHQLDCRPNRVHGNKVRLGKETRQLIELCPLRFVTVLLLVAAAFNRNTTQ